jgi:hypothetical protein
MRSRCGLSGRWSTPSRRSGRRSITASRPWSRSKKAELAIVKSDIQSIRDALTSHVAKEDVVYEIFKRVMNTGVSITGALIALLLAIIGYLLVHPAGLQ